MTKLNRQEMLDLLLSVKPGLGNKDRVEQATSFIFSGAYIITYNEKVMIIADNPYADHIEGAVRANELIDVLKKSTAENITLSATEEGELVLKSGRGKSGIRFSSEIRVPFLSVLDEYNEADSYNIPRRMIDALKEASFCASRSMQDVNLTGIHVKKGLATATDGYKMMQAKFKAGKVPEFIIPASVIDSLTSYDIEYITLTPSWIIFTTKDDLLFCVRQIKEKDPYPDLSKHLEPKGRKIELPKSILDALDKAEIFTSGVDKDKDRFVELEFSSGKVVVKGTGPHGWHEETLKVPGCKDEFSFRAHPGFLRYILPVVQEAHLSDISMHFEAENFVHVFVLTKKEPTEEETEDGTDHECVAYAGMDDVPF